jgi:hypothetical protein
MVDSLQIFRELRVLSDLYGSIYILMESVHSTGYVATFLV